MSNWKARFLLAVGILSMLYVALQSTASNLHVGFVFQVILSVSLILYAILFDRIPITAHITAAVACSVPIFFIIFLGVYGNINRADYTEDVLIVLGAGVRGEEVSLHLAHRLDRAATYLADNPRALVIVTGGLGNRASITEAEAMERYLLAKGVAPERIIQENQSTSTYENLAFSRDILYKYFPEGFRAALITNDFHIYRAIRTSRRVGIYAYGIGAPTPLFSLPINYLREMLAVVHMWVNLR